MTQLIGFTGRLTSGKDTACAMLSDILADGGRTLARRGFADKLKQSAYRAFKPDCTVEEAVEWANELKFNGQILLEQEIEGTGHFVDIGVGMQQVSANEHDITEAVTGREYLQHYGTEAHRDIFGDDFWVDALLPDPARARSRAMGDTVDPRDITDLWLAKAADGADVLAVTDVRFENEGRRIRELGGMNVRIERPGLSPLAPDAHASERGLPDGLVDHVIVNDDTLATLEKSVWSFAVLQGLV